MLVDRETIYKTIRCPKTREKLTKKEGKLLSPKNEGISYDIINGYPVLIDFEQSILNENDIETLSSVIHRENYTGIQRFVKKLLSIHKETTSINIEYIRKTLKSNNKNNILIIGGGSIGQGIESLYDDKDLSLIAFDIYATNNVQFIADAHNIPLPDCYFDAVIIQAVLEHVLEPHTVVKEINRVLRDNGIVYAETPFLQHVHEGAYDFMRFTDSGHRYLFKDFKVINSGFYSGAGTQLLWSLDNYFRGLFRSKKVGKIIKLLFFWLQYTDNIIPDSYNIDAASSVFFLGKKRKQTNKEVQIVEYYQGAQK